MSQADVLEAPRANVRVYFPFRGMIMTYTSIVNAETPRGKPWNMRQAAKASKPGHAPRREPASVAERALVER